MSRQIGVPARPPLDRRGSGSTDILRGVVERSAGKPEEKLEEKIARVIEKVKTTKAIPTTPGPPVPIAITQSSPIPSGRTTPSSSAPGSAHVSSRALSPLLEGQQSASPSSVNSRSNSRQGSGSLQNTAASVNRIISRHRQQPSIASIMSDISGPGANEHGEDDWEGRDRDRDRDGNTTPATATSSSHPTPPLGTSIFMRAVNSTSPTPRQPVRYTDDFGMKTLMGLVEARAREMRPKAKKERKAVGAAAGPEEEVTRLLWGEKIGRDEMEEMAPEIRSCLGRAQLRLDGWDAELDGLLASLGGGMR